MTYEFTKSVRFGIVRYVATIDVAGIGPVSFERPSMLQFGRVAWHTDFSFEIDGREYWGVLSSFGDSDISTRDKNARARRLPETAKQAWREAIAKVGRAIIRDAKQRYLAAVESDDSDLARQIKHGLEPKPAKVEPEYKCAPLIPNPVDDCAAYVPAAPAKLKPTIHCDMARDYVESYFRAQGDIVSAGTCKVESVDGEDVATVTFLYCDGEYYQMTVWYETSANGSPYLYGEW